MSADTREIIEGLQDQGVHEVIAYTLTVPLSWGENPTSPTIKVYSVVGTTYTDVTATVIPSGTASVLGQVITWPHIRALTMGMLYFVEMTCLANGNTLEPFAWIRCNR